MVGWQTFLGFFLGLFARQEFNADLLAGHAHQAATAVRQTRRRQQQKEFLEVQSFEGSLDAQPRAALRHVEHHAVPAPGSIYSHDENRDAALEIDTLVLSV